MCGCTVPIKSYTFCYIYMYVETTNCSSNCAYDENFLSDFYSIITRLNDITNDSRTQLSHILGERGETSAQDYTQNEKF